MPYGLEIALIIFDCDGVIVDSEKVVMKVFGAALRELGLHYSWEELFEQFVGLSVTETYHKVEQQLGRPLGGEFAQQQVARTEQELINLLKPVPGIPHLLHHIKHPYCLASNSDHKKIRLCLETTELYHYFDGKIFSAVEDLAKPKPAPDIYLYSATKMGLAPRHCLVIEDTPAGVSAAKAAGMTVLGYTACTPAQRLIAAGADRVFDNMGKLLDMLYLQ